LNGFHQSDEIDQARGFIDWPYFYLADAGWMAMGKLLIRFPINQTIG